MSKLLVIAFAPDEAVRSVGFAQAVGLPYDILFLTGEPATDLGADRCLAANLSEVPPADGIARFLADFAAEYSHVAALSSMRSKDVMARVAGRMRAGMITDAIGVESPSVFRRPILAGSIIETVETLSFPILLTFRPAGFPKPERTGASSVELIAATIVSAATRVAQTAQSGTRPDLGQAKVIVSGGRPLRDAETFERVIGGLADRLGGAVGATRAAVDSGIAHNELQVGQTGKIVAPDLYIAAGISGSTQHMAGIKDSKVIVAINKDPDAPIFEFADLGIVADLYDAIPAFVQALGDS
ncbi:MAG: electron transfer flavoprotein subunit alpha/FixB family protein [Fimbriimonas sp.]|nr:electron transfer flavoprotein subunit alpha/FixB family protein [Fimbriimonas sp.]